MTQDRRDGQAADSRADAIGGIALGSCVLTLEGELPVEYLSPGDRVITRTGARALRRITARRIRDGLFAVAPQVLGGDRPKAEIRLAAGTGIVLRDWRAQALYGAEVAVVGVERLADGSYIRAIDGATTVFVLEFDGCEVIYADGLEIACAPVHAEA